MLSTFHKPGTHSTNHFCLSLLCDKSLGQGYRCVFYFFVLRNVHIYIEAQLIHYLHYVQPHQFPRWTNSEYIYQWETGSWWMKWIWWNGMCGWQVRMGNECKGWNSWVTVRGKGRDGVGEYMKWEITAMIVELPHPVFHMYNLSFLVGLNEWIKSHTLFNIVRLARVWLDSLA